jgi:hypothetical protein
MLGKHEVIAFVATKHPEQAKGFYSSVIDTISAILAAFAFFFRSRLDLSLEVLALRQQLAV